MRKILLLMMIILFSGSALALDFSVDGLRAFNNTGTNYIFEAKVIGTGNYSYIMNYDHGPNNTGLISSKYAYFNHNYTGRYGPVNASFTIGNDDNNANNKKTASFCIKGVEIPNNGIDEDCNGGDLIVNILINITILSPIENNQSQTWFGDNYMHDWNISVKTNDTADSCWYEFGIREDFRVTKPIYFSITSSGTLNKINSTYFTKSNVDPLGDHNYLRLFCNNTVGQVFNTSEHIEIDTTPPGTITDLYANVSNTDKDYIDLIFTLPGDDGFENTSRIRYLDIRWSNSPINKTNYNLSQQIPIDKTLCYFNEWTNNFTPGKIRCLVYTNKTYYNLINHTTKRYDYYFAIKTSDNVGHISNISNTAYRQSPLYQCIIDNIIFKNLNSSAPFESDLTRTYTSPYGNNPQVLYEGTYTGDKILLNYSIRNVGDGTNCLHFRDSFFDNILGATNEYYNISFNKTKEFSYNWVITTSTTQNFKSLIQTSSEDKMFMDFKFDFYGMNLSKYLISVEGSPTNKIINPPLPDSSQYASYWIYNNADSLNTNVGSLVLDKVSIKWLPTKIHYMMISGTTTPPIFGGTIPYKQIINGDIVGLPDEFKNYTCGTNNECLMPYAKYTSNNAPNLWTFQDMECGGSYNMWVTAGAYQGKYKKLITSNNVTVTYC